MDIMTSDDVCRELAVTKQTLYLWRHKRLGPQGFRAGKHLRFRRSDVESWIDEQIAAEAS